MPSPALLLALAAGLGVLAVPLIFEWVPPNHFYGFRTPRTLADTDVWYRVNRFGGWSLLVAAAVSIVLQLVVPSSRYAWLELLLPVCIAVAAALVYLRNTA